MKRLNTNLVTTDIGLVFQHKHLDFIQDKTEESLIHWVYNKIGGVNTNAIILYGCVGTFSTTTTTDDTLTITAGAVSFAGKIYEVAAATQVKTGTNVHTLKILGVTYDASDPSLFTDGVSRNVQEIKVVALSVQASGAGISNWADVVRLDSFNAYSQGVINTQNTGQRIATAVVNIGAWNMNTTPSINIAYIAGIARNQIRRVSALIISDDGSLRCDLGITITSSDVGGNIQLVSSNMVLSRGTGLFQNPNYSDPGTNRGYLYIEYTN